jgi:hypothetical protein
MNCYLCNYLALLCPGCIEQPKEEKKIFIGSGEDVSPEILEEWEEQRTNVLA